MPSGARRSASTRRPSARRYPLYHELDAARAAGHADLVAPPMFAAVYAGRALAPCLFDPELAIDFSMLVHGCQDFRWERLVLAGDEISTVVTVLTSTSAPGFDFYAFQTTSREPVRRARLHGPVDEHRQGAGT